MLNKDDSDPVSVQKHPRNPRTFGSTLKNPPDGKFSASGYLEKVGMKGMRVGDAKVAWEHANWILNRDNATSSDVKKLIEVGQKGFLKSSASSLNARWFFCRMMFVRRNKRSNPFIFINSESS